MSAGYRLHRAEKLQLDGALDRAVASVVEESCVHLVGVQAPVGTKGVGSHVLGLIRACRSAVLVYRGDA